MYLMWRRIFEENSRIRLGPNCAKLKENYLVFRRNRNVICQRHLRLAAKTGVNQQIVRKYEIRAREWDREGKNANLRGKTRNWGIFQRWQCQHWGQRDHEKVRGAGLGVGEAWKSTIITVSNLLILTLFNQTFL